MTRQEYLNELNKAFGDFKFFAEDHHYEYKGKRVGISVTTFYAQYENEFNEQEMAEKSATKYNKSINEILNDWHYKRDFSCDKGTTIHEYIQSLFSGNEYRKLTFDESKEYLDAVDKCQRQADNFYNDYKDRLEHLADEYTIGSDEYNIASNIDHLFINKLTGGLILVDYKTNKEMSGYNKKPYKKAMKVPLNHLNDDAYNHYKIQLSIYKYLVEKYTNLKFEEMFIVYFSENIENYEIIEIPYLKDEVEKILENRREKNMNSVPVLLIGKSGSGKSTSLRNFKGDEVAVVNVLGKPLPFKSDIKAPKCDDYATILKAIASTPKKTIVIDDAGYLITNEFMKNSSIKGYDKFNNMANNFWNLINAIKNIEGGKTIYLIMHEDIDDLQNIKPKTIGHLLDEKVDIQGLFTICIRSVYEDGKYLFKLKTNGQDCVKTPFDMIAESEMENDLKAFDKIVREYYELDKVEEGENK